jgi:methionine-rich copper-binding protein CopC
MKHIRLLRSEPSADSTVSTAPTAIRFWFSGPVQIPVMTVRMLDSANRVIEMVKPRAGDSANTVTAEVKGAMTPGRHTVAWRTMARDGHVVSGRFTFVLAAPSAPAR